MNKKIIIVTAIILSAIATATYVATRPKELSNCDVLLTKMLEAKTYAEHEFAADRWKLICVTNEK